MSPDGFNCTRSVKDGNPEKFKYCSDRESRLNPSRRCSLDGCKYQHCEHSKHEGSKGYCPQHSCLAAPHSSCDKPRLVDDGSFFCEVHTCEAQTCRAEVAGRGDKGDASRSCDKHRRCARDGCSGPCHTRDTGATVKWCGLHYCQEASCPSDRAPGNKQYCKDHVCMEPLCGAGKQDMGTGRYCLDHQCKTDKCLERRDQRARGSEHCALHICWVERCPKPAAVGNRCDDHRYCREQGCKGYIFIEKGPEGDIKYPTCENRELSKPPSMMNQPAVFLTDMTHNRPQGTMPGHKPWRQPLRQAPRQGPDLLQGPLVRAGQLPQPAQLRVGAVLRGAQVHGRGVPAAAQEHHRRPGPGRLGPASACQPASRQRRRGGRRRRRGGPPGLELLRRARVRRGRRQVWRPRGRAGKELVLPEARVLPPRVRQGGHAAAAEEELDWGLL
ncbi:hypothetical protein diail_333 [Diaporthe ilicicola]|nr:hypothetical protein diail_333 [Diaporthe ilicicola]